MYYYNLSEIMNVYILNSLKNIEAAANCTVLQCRLYFPSQSASNTAQQSQIENLFDSDTSVEENVKNSVSCDIIMWH